MKKGVKATRRLFHKKKRRKTSPLSNRGSHFDSPIPPEQIPSSIFINRSLSVLEAIAVYLKEKKNLTYHQIAILLNRNDRTIWTVYNRGKKKLSTPTKKPVTEILIPTSVFRDRSLAVLEILAEYLFFKHKLSYHEIAVLLNRDDRTIWTVINRGKKKRSSRGRS